MLYVFSGEPTICHLQQPAGIIQWKTPVMGGALVTFNFAQGSCEVTKNYIKLMIFHIEEIRG